MTNNDIAATRQLLDDTDAWLVQLDRKVEVDDVTDDHITAAGIYLDGYCGTFEFLRNMQQQHEHGRLTRAMVKGILNCMRAELLRSKKTAA